MRILVIGAHVDDLDLTMGATIAKLREKPNIIKCVILSDSSTIKENKDYNLRQECKSSMIDTLEVDGLLIGRFETMEFTRDFQKIRDYIFDLKDFVPDIVFCTSPNALHPDHKRIGEAVESIFMETTIYGVEDIRGNHKQLINKWIPVEKKHIQKKIEALSSYKSQSKRRYFDFDQIEATAKARGLQIGTQYAEGFEVIREVGKTI